MTCRGVCGEVKLDFLQMSLGVYKKGIVRCQECEVYLKYEGVYCPCCGTRVRSSARTYGKKNKREKMTVG